MKKLSLKPILNKFIIFTLVFIGLFTVSIETFSSTKTTIPDGNGGVITRIGTNDPVYINVDYDLKDTEFRAVWVSPLVGDIPTFTSEDQYKKVMLDVLDTMEKYTLNVLVYHIRIMNDAFYKSEYNYYSKYYSTNPTWEALPWIIEECHKRGIEFHAWMNPYRLTNNPDTNFNDLAQTFPAKNIASDPQYYLKGTNSIILNPGEPLVKEFLLNVVMEVVENYDVDAIHFDDYFYDANVDDSHTRALYDTTNLGRDNFRRAQVDDFIQRLSVSMRSYNLANNKRVQLGISPSGIWKSGNGVVTYDSSGNAITNGSNTTSTYEHYEYYLFSDTLKWVNEEWIDYIIPQAYWALNHPSAAYADLMEWWDKVVLHKDVKVFAGLGIYLSDSSTGYGWYTSVDEAYYQIMFTNTLDNVNGVCFFKYSHIYNAVVNPNKTRGVNGIWTKPVIIPEITTMPRININKVSNLDVTYNEAGNKISFDKKEDAKFYVIYRSTSPLTFSSDEVLKVIGDLSDNGIVNYTDTQVNSSTKYYYGVRPMSVSNTLGEGVSKSTEGIKESGLQSLGEITDLRLSDALQAGLPVSVIFKPFYYPLGGNVSYSLEYKFDNKEKVVIDKFTLRNGLYYTTLTPPNDSKTLEITLTVKNSIGISSRKEVYNVSKGLKNITNFGIVGDAYASQEATFVFNNPHIEGGAYSLQYSIDGLSFNELTSFTSSDLTFNIVKKANLPSFTGTIYFRVCVSKDDAIGYSNTFTASVFEYYGDFKNLKINGKGLSKYYIVSEGEKLTFEWVRHDGEPTYSTFYSTNRINWLTITSYSKTSYISINNNVCSLPVVTNYQTGKLYVRIVVTSGSKRSQTIDFEIYVRLRSAWSDSSSFYLLDDIVSNISELGIFGG